jgi:uncharacterized membrane protein
MLAFTLAIRGKLLFGVCNNAVLPSRKGEEEMNYPQTLAIIGIWIAVAIMAPALSKPTTVVAILAVGATSGLILLWGKND